MNIRIATFPIILLSIVLSMPVAAQSYEKLWKEVNTLQEKDLPTSMLEQVEKIYRKAYKERNTPQMMKAYTYKLSFRSSISPDSLYIDVKGLEDWVSTTEDSLDQAILHSMLGEIYANYLSHSYYGFSNTSQLIGLVDNPEEWTVTALLRKSFDHFLLSLSNKDLLAQTSTKKYTPIVDFNDGSVYYKHDLLHMLAFRAIETLQGNIRIAEQNYNQRKIEKEISYWNLPVFLNMEIAEVSEMDYKSEILKIYQQVLQYYNLYSEKSALLLTDLARLNFINDYLYDGSFLRKSEDMAQSPYYQQLKEALNLYSGVKGEIEIYIKLVDYLRQNNQSVEALRFAEEGINKYPTDSQTNFLKNQKADILNPELWGFLAENSYVGDKIELKVNYRNFIGLNVNLYKIDLPADSEILANYNDSSFRSAYLTNLVLSEKYKLEPVANYQGRDTTLYLPRPDKGIWMIEFSADDSRVANQYNILYVTNLRVVNRKLPDDKYEFVVFDSESGYPVSGAEVKLYSKEKNQFKLHKSLTTNVKGTATINADKNYSWITVVKEGDIAMKPYSIGYSSFRGAIEAKSYEGINLFTDRSIYRPGQTVYVAGIAYKLENDETGIISERDYKIQLYDVNNRIVGEKEVQTNEFGSFSTEFILPASVLNGNFRLVAGRNSTSIRVEEYKRPTFNVQFNPLSGSYTLNDSVTLQGLAKTFSGVPLQNNEVRYTVIRQIPFGFIWREAPVTIDSGEVMTDEDGNFTINLLLEPSEIMKELPYWFYTYKVEATVTNGAGETQMGTYSINVGNRSLVLSTSLQEDILKENLETVTFFAKNLNQQLVDVKGEYAIYIVDSENKIGNKILDGTFISNQPFIIKELKDLSSGKYRLILTANDEQQREVKYETDFILYSMRDKRLPVEMVNWFKPVNTEFNKQQPATILFGTSKQDVWALYDVFSGNERLESKWIHLSDSVINLELPYKEMYGAGIVVQITFVKEGEIYQNEARITKTLPEKELEMKWEVFRDKLTPGQQEEWILSVKYPNGKLAKAEVTATLYDASLDKFVPHDWKITIPFPRILPYITWNSNDQGQAYFNMRASIKYLDFSYIKYDNLILNSLLSAISYKVVPAYGNANIKVRGSGPLTMSRAPVMEEGADVLYSVEENGEAVPVIELQPAGQVRKNLSETAFFYPQLCTDKDGKVKISFTLPESLTEWNFIGISHTKQMDYGKLTGKSVASKDFMVTPYMPRFLRFGDKSSIASGITNLTDKDIKGMIRLELFDPETEKIYISESQSYEVQAGKTITIKFPVIFTDENISLLVCRIVADGGRFSDGEQSYLPVLSDKVRITETIPLSLVGKEAKTWSLDSLYNRNSSTATNRSLIFEYSGNPAWYAVEALPSLSNPANDNAISWIISYYANNISASILRNNPRIQTMFNAWKAEGAGSLWSELQKNQELKNILLEETPWVMEATTEAEQRERLALLFDMNYLQNSNTQVILKLQDLQFPDGSWSWYKGMSGNKYVTQFIIETLIRLSVLTDNKWDSEVQQMYDKGLDYLHSEFLKEYEQAIKQQVETGKPQRPSPWTIRYLYIYALSQPQVSEKNEEAVNYFIKDLSAFIREFTIYGKAFAAIISYKNGQLHQADDFINSLREYAITTSESGTYYDTPSLANGWFSERIPTQVAVIEAFEMIRGAEKDFINNLKVWLLKQKQSQMWDNPVSSANAVYALLYSNGKLLDNKGVAHIQLGNHTMEVTPETSLIPGVAYVKEVYSEAEAINVNNVTIRKEDDGLAWGAIYVQYQEAISNVKGSLNAGFSVDKKIFIQHMVDGKSQLIPVEEEAYLSTGDKIVSRLTLKVDRDMDFVHLKDQRAASFEPYNSLSGYRYQNGLGYYISNKDASTEFFFDTIRKGTYMLEQTYFVVREGEYSSGIATLQSMYAPEFSAFSNSTWIKVK